MLPAFTLSRLRVGAEVVAETALTRAENPREAFWVHRIDDEAALSLSNLGHPAPVVCSRRLFPGLFLLDTCGAA